VRAVRSHSKRFRAEIGQVYAIQDMVHMRVTLFDTISCWLAAHMLVPLGTHTCAAIRGNTV
jgi:hypothetical protein